MPLTCSQIETKSIIDGSSDGVTRMYPTGCPHQPGTQIILTSRFLAGHRDQDLAFARVTVKSIRPETVERREKDDKLAKMEGFTSGREWAIYFRKMYGPVAGGQECFRLQFRIDKMDKGAPISLTDEKPKGPRPDDIADMMP